MTFAAWEKKVRMYDEFVTIFTECLENGEVIKAFCHGQIWIK